MKASILDYAAFAVGIYQHRQDESFGRLEQELVAGAGLRAIAEADLLCEDNADRITSLLFYNPLRRASDATLSEVSISDDDALIPRLR